MNAVTSPSTPLKIRTAIDLDIPEIVRVTNLAFRAESFCVSGERTDAADIRQRFASGTFFVIDNPADRTRLLGSVYCAVIEGRGYLGLISVEPGARGLGLAHLLIGAVADRCRERGCSFLDITVVNAREDLFPLYARFGFAACDVLPFPVPEKALRPLLLVKMTKPLQSPAQLTMAMAQT